MNFSYQEMTSRNIGFITPAQQKTLSEATIFIPGVGGIGGAALEALARMGVQKFIIADVDSFSVPNLNGQVFCSMETVGRPRIEATKEQLLLINPDMQIETFGADWVNQLHLILPRVNLVVNGCDDILSSVSLLRSAVQDERTVINAFRSVLSSVYVVRPDDPRPEEFMGFPTVGKPIQPQEKSLVSACRLKELEYVMCASSSADHVLWEYSREVIKGQRARFSLAPLVFMTGGMMAFEAMNVLLHQESKVTYRGVFWNPWRCQIEFPPGALLHWWRAWQVRRVLRQL